MKPSFFLKDEKNKKKNRIFKKEKNQQKNSLNLNK